MIFLLFFANTYRGYGLFSAIQDSQPRMSQFPWVIWYLFQGSWRLTNKINQCNDTNLLHATSHLWLRVAWSSQNGLEPFQPHFLRWHEPLLHQTSGFSTGWSWSNCKSWLTNMEFSWLKLDDEFRLTGWWWSQLLHSYSDTTCKKNCGGVPRKVSTQNGPHIWEGGGFALLGAV